MNELESKAKQIYLRMNSYSNCSQMNGIDREWILKKIKDGLQEYAKEYHQSELLKLNKSDVISSVCNNDETLKVRNKTIEICKKCGEPRICG